MNWASYSWLAGPLLAAAALVAVVVGVLYYVWLDHQWFMAECTADRPRYECVALYRGGRP